MIFIILHNHLNFTLPSNGAEVSVVREGDVIRWVPVEAGKCYHHQRCYHSNHYHKLFFIINDASQSITLVNIKRPVAAHGEGDSVQHVVYGTDHLIMLLLILIMIKKMRMIKMMIMIVIRMIKMMMMTSSPL